MASTAKYLHKDTEGDLWYVLPGDPAHDLLDQLARLDWEPSLPPCVLVEGNVNPTCVADHRKLVEEYGAVEGLTDLLLSAHDTFTALDYLHGRTT